MNIVSDCILPIYDAKFVLIAGKDDKFLKEKLKKRVGDNTSSLFDIERQAGSTQAFNCTKNGITRRVFAIRLVDTSNDIAMTHEAIHCAWDILNDRGVIIDYNNHEALTYLVDYLVRIMKMMMK